MILTLSVVSSFLNLYSVKTIGIKKCFKRIGEDWLVVTWSETAQGFEFSGAKRRGWHWRENNRSRLTHSHGIFSNGEYTYTSHMSFRRFLRLGEAVDAEKRSPLQRASKISLFHAWTGSEYSCACFTCCRKLIFIFFFFIVSKNTFYCAKFVSNFLLLFASVHWLSNVKPLE